MWVFYAILSALFSALVAIFSKVGLQGMNSHFATAVRTTGVMAITWLFVWGMGVKGEQMQISKKQLLFLILSACATGGAWMAYNRALQIGPATRVASIDKMSIVLIAFLSWLVFHESMSVWSVVGVGMIAAGTVVLVVS